MAEKNLERIGSVILDYTYYKGEDLYSEGVAEDRLLDYVKDHTALDYEHYIQQSRSWSAMYHLSYIRENIVSWLPIKPTEKVLEVGSGCGAVTGTLARLSKSVTCVELSKKRSLINAYRNKEYDNLTIMVGNFEDVEKGLTEKYDYITLIGVLEYAASYISSERPYHAFLETLKKHLNPGGKIVIAIENRLGLKYFAGCKEDHLGEYFGGIMGYAPDSGVKTFSKGKLTELIRESGFNNCKFYYPYPDYKLPHTIYSDDRLPGLGELNTNLRNFDADRIVLFDETRAFDTMIEEKMFPQVANSFLVIASDSEDMFASDVNVPIYAKYGNERVDKFRVCTAITRDNKGNKKVYKTSLSTRANEHIKRMGENYARLKEQYASSGFVPARCDYIKGKEKGIPLAGVTSKARDVAVYEFIHGITLEDYLNELLENECYEQMEKVITQYVEKLKATSDEVSFVRCQQFDEIFGKRDFKKKYVALSPCNFDMIFSNIILDEEKRENGDWTVLDYEWVFECSIPVQFVVYRALFYFFHEKNDDGFSVYLSKKGMDVYSMCGIDIGERMLFSQMEQSFQVYIIGAAASLEVMQVLMPSATLHLEEMIKMGSYLRNLDTPIVYYSRSWALSEDNQISVIASVKDGAVTMKIPFDNYINYLRIDPTDYPCLLKLYEAKYIMNDGSFVGVDNVLVNGHKITDNSFMYDTNDAQLVFDKVPQNAKALEVSYHVSMIENEFYEDFLGILKKKEADEQNERMSVSYRTKRKLGIVKEEALPEGFKRMEVTIPSLLY